MPAHLLPFASLEAGLDVQLVKDGCARRYQVIPTTDRRAWAFWFERGPVPEIGVRQRSPAALAWLRSIAQEVQRLIDEGWEVADRELDLNELGAFAPTPARGSQDR